MGVDDELEAVMSDAAVPSDVTVTMAGLRVTDGPAGDTVLFSVTFPANALMLVMLSVELAEPPTVNARVLGLAVMMKSGEVRLAKVAA